jgi:hypothetical protein
MLKQSQYSKIIRLKPILMSTAHLICSEIKGKNKSFALPKISQFERLCPAGKPSFSWFFHGTALKSYLTYSIF